MNSSHAQYFSPDDLVVSTSAVWNQVTCNLSPALVVSVEHGELIAHMTVLFVSYDGIAKMSKGWSAAIDRVFTPYLFSQYE